MINLKNLRIALNFRSSKLETIIFLKYNRLIIENKSNNYFLIIKDAFLKQISYL